MGRERRIGRPQNDIFTSWPSPDLIRGSVPAIPILKSGALHAIEITGTRPVMT